MKPSIPVCALALAGCAVASPPPDSELAAARAMVIQAEPLAGRHAPAELRLAQAKLARAQEAAGRREWREARRLAGEAEVDARYALALAENERSRQ